MLKKMILGSFCLLMCFFPVFTNGCARKTFSESALVGKWQRTGAKYSFIEFSGDGKVVSTTKLSKKTLTKLGTYQIADATHVSLTVQSPSSQSQPREIQVEYHISGTHLTMKYPNNLTLEFDKIE